jgi:flagellar protein FlaI
MVARNVSSRPEIIIRRVRKQFQTIEDLLEIGSINRAFVEYVKALIERRGSMIIAGPPGSGKTTLLRSILYNLIPKSWKIAIIEDTAEIDPPHGSSWTRYTSFELGRVKVDLFDLAKASLRSSAQILLVVGEVRGSEAQVLAQAMLAGMGGLTTFHGGTPEEVITRLRSHPIGLSNSQISMFWSIAFMGFQQENPRRVLRRVVELLPRGDDPPEVVDLYDISIDGRDPDPMLLISRSKRLRG